MDHNSKRAVVLCDGEPPSEELLKLELTNSDLLIATDGGAISAIDSGFMPDLVIGDMDSLDMNRTYPFPVIKDEDQETNDLEKALSYLHDKGFKIVVILGATGQRTDHTLKNLSVLKQFSGTFENLFMKDRFGTIFLLQPDYRFNTPKGLSISLFPLSGKVEGITTSGLMYPLSNEPLENGIRDGSSNEAVSGQVHIRYKRGDLLIFISRSDHFKTGWFEP